MISLIYLAVQAVVYFAVKDDANNNDSPSSAVKILLLIVGVLLGFLAIILFGFCLFHLWLQMRNKTTREFIKKAGSSSNSNNNLDSMQAGNDWLGVSKPMVDYSHKLTEEDVQAIVLLQ